MVNLVCALRSNFLICTCAPLTRTSMDASRITTILPVRMSPSTTVLASSFVAKFLYEKVIAKGSCRPSKLVLVANSLLTSRSSTLSFWPVSAALPARSASSELGMTPLRPISVSTIAPLGLICNTSTSIMGSVPSFASAVSIICCQAMLKSSSDRDTMNCFAFGSPPTTESASPAIMRASTSSPICITSFASAMGFKEHSFSGINAHVFAPISMNAPSPLVDITVPGTRSPTFNFDHPSYVLPTVHFAQSV
mmetsp:Transcript_2316/g.5717  ORF Transcript_2316/g.5717 Transcript_2316/m.5717 type:complete len:251 (+) Transcript_2316:401-1153(+)